MNIQITCSSCGHKSRNYRIDRNFFCRPAEKIVYAGWDSFGDAFYCPKCVKTWEKRNGKDRPLWGNEHTKLRIYEVMIGRMMDWIEYMEKGEYPV